MTTGKGPGWLPLWLCLLLLAGEAARADTVVLLAVADTRLREQEPDTNQGYWDTVVSGTQGLTAGAPRNRALFKFDPTTRIPPQSTIDSVWLLLKVVQVPADRQDSIFELHRMVKPWAELEATWRVRALGFPWAAEGAAAGTDYVATVSASREVNGMGGYIFGSTPALVADVQSGLDDPTNNFGWILISRSEDLPCTARHFGSRENPNQTDLPPALQIAFTPPLRIENAEIVDHQFRFNFLALAGKTYVVERRPMAGSGSWSVVTNLSAQTVAQWVVFTGEVSGGAAFYRVGAR